MVGEKRVLVVDDDLNMRIFISTLLKVNGFQPIVTKDGKEGIKKAKTDFPDLIILDIMMPEQGGISMYQQLKRDEKLKNIPVIMLSGVESHTFTHSLKIIMAGNDVRLPDPEAYVEKPPKAEALLTIIKKILKCSD